MNRVAYATIQDYLDAIADNPACKGSIDNSSHGRFWSVDYRQFVSGTVPNEDCGGLAIAITDLDPNKCPFYQALKNPAGWCSLGQMPLQGPFITDSGFTVTLKDGSAISGPDIDANIVWWLTNKMPEI